MLVDLQGLINRLCNMGQPVPVKQKKGKCSKKKKGGK
jgi:hypothetical protein